MAILFKKDSLNKKYKIVADADKHIISPRFQFEGNLSDIKDENQLDDMIKRESPYVELVKEEPSKKTN